MSASDERGSKGESFAALFEQSTDAQRARRGVSARVGERLEVTVVAIGRDSVFVDLGGKQEGFFERIELEDEEGKLRVDVGARVSAQIANVDRETGQVRLTPIFVRRSAAEEESSSGGDELRIPVTRSKPLLVEGSRVKGIVVSVERYGVFVQISGTQGRGGRGLVPTAETGTPRNSDLKKLFPVGTEIEAKILAIDEQGRIRLSVKALAADEERGDYASYLEKQTGDVAAEGAAEPAQKAKGAPKKPAKPEPKNFGTLGDLLRKR